MRGPFVAGVASCREYERREKERKDALHRRRQRLAQRIENQQRGIPTWGILHPALLEKETDSPLRAHYYRSLFPPSSVPTTQEEEFRVIKIVQSCGHDLKPLLLELKDKVLGVKRDKDGHVKLVQLPSDPGPLALAEEGRAYAAEDPFPMARTRSELADMLADALSHISYDGQCDHCILHDCPCLKQTSPANPTTTEHSDNDNDDVTGDAAAEEEQEEQEEEEEEVNQDPYTDTDNWFFPSQRDAPLLPRGSLGPSSNGLCRHCVVNECGCVGDLKKKNRKWKSGPQHALRCAYDFAVEAGLIDDLTERWRRPPQPPLPLPVVSRAPRPMSQATTIVPGENNDNISSSSNENDDREEELEQQQQQRQRQQRPDPITPPPAYIPLRPVRLPDPNADRRTEWEIRWDPKNKKPGFWGWVMHYPLGRYGPHLLSLGLMLLMILLIMVPDWDIKASRLSDEEIAANKEMAAAADEQHGVSF